MTRAALRPVSMTDAVTTDLRAQILGGGFTPGAPVAESVVAADYGIARPTVRVAIQALVTEGLLRREPGRRAYVPWLTAADVRDVFVVRIPVELAAVEQVLANGGRPAAAEAAADAMAVLPSDAPPLAIADADLAVHRALVEAADSPRLARVHASLEAEIRLCLAQLHQVAADPVALAAEHRTLLAAIVAGDAERALALLRDHLDQAAGDLLATVPSTGATP